MTTSFHLLLYPLPGILESHRRGEGYTNPQRATDTKGSVRRSTSNQIPQSYPYYIVNYHDISAIPTPSVRITNSRQNIQYIIYYLLCFVAVIPNLAAMLHDEY